MRFTPLAIQGAYLLDIEARTDDRGFFARTVCLKEFSDHGLNGNFVQQSVSWNPFAGTLRGLHFQEAPHQEEKLVRVTRGAVFDVIVDLRTESSTFGEWLGMELSAENRRQLFIPAGVAHGFQTTETDTEVFYEMTTYFHPESARGLRWSDPCIGVNWPNCSSRIISESDQILPLWQERFGHVSLDTNS